MGSRAEARDRTRFQPRDRTRIANGPGTKATTIEPKGGEGGGSPKPQQGPRQKPGPPMGRVQKPHNGRNGAREAEARDRRRFQPRDQGRIRCWGKACLSSLPRSQAVEHTRGIASGLAAGGWRGSLPAQGLGQAWGCGWLHHTSVWRCDVLGPVSAAVGGQAGQSVMIGPCSAGRLGQGSAGAPSSIRGFCPGPHPSRERWYVVSPVPVFRRYRRFGVAVRCWCSWRLRSVAARRRWGFGL